MTETLIINLSLIILFLPLLGFSILIFFGKRVKPLYLLGTAFLGINFILAVIVAYTKLSIIEAPISAGFTWIDFGEIPLFGHFTMDLGIKIDNLTAIMLIVVNLISFLVHLYSMEYMRGDKRFNRYYAYLGIFTFSMLGIVLTDNLLMMYIFWELVGLCSYLLIGFWFEKKSAADASKKAFLVNRVGDIGMWLGILILFTNYHTFSFDKIFESMAAGNLPFGSEVWLTATGILIFMGAVGKSAQFPLHVWLPDAMEGPTPVSALIHAATMVAAGVYLVARVFVMLSADALLVIAVIGAITSFFAASIALTQNDIKKVLAYSTVSQLGYMILSMGIGAYAFAFFHLVTHAWFKACLFLGSGSVIHSMHHEQDMRQMGGLKKKMPITYWAFVISSLAISGIPLTSGFLSKDGILQSSFAFGSLTGHWLIPILGFIVALMTAFYMFRLILLTFHGEPRNKEKYDHAHESPKVMTIPLIILSILSIFIWYTPNPFSADSGWFLTDWVKTPHTIVPASSAFEFMVSETAEQAVEAGHEIVHSEMYMEAMHHAHVPTMILSLVLAVGGILLAFLLYEWKKIDPDKLAKKFKPLYNGSLNKWYIDEIYDATFISGALAFSNFLYWFDSNIVDGIVNGAGKVTVVISKISNVFDKYVVDGLVNFSAFISGFIGLSFSKIQTGKVQTYLVFVVFSVIILFLIFQPFI